MIDKLNKALGFHEKALHLRAQQQQQQALASNIANADTPNLKARDFDLVQAMPQLWALRPLPQSRQFLHFP